MEDSTVHKEQVDSNTIHAAQVDISPLYVVHAEEQYSTCRESNPIYYTGSIAVQYMWHRWIAVQYIQKIVKYR